MKFDGELRPLATLATRFVSGLGAGTPDEVAIESTASLQKVLSDTSLDPALGLEEYGDVDDGTTNTITMAAPDTSFTLDRRLPTGHYVLTIEGDAPDFHWMPAITDERFSVDLRSASSDGTTPVGPASIEYPRFPRFDIVVGSATTPDVLDSIVKVIRTIDPLPAGGEAALCAASLPEVSLSGSPVPDEVPATAALRTVAYVDVPGESGGFVTIPQRSVEIDRAAPETMTVVVCRDQLEPESAVVNTLAPNTDTTVALTLNPATRVRTFWDDFGTERTDFTDGMTITVNGVVLTGIGNGIYQTGRFAPTDTFTSTDISIVIPAGYPGYTSPDLTGVTVTGGDQTDLELPTTSEFLRVPVFQKTGSSFDDIVVTATSVEDDTQAFVADQQSDCAADATTPTVTQCDFFVNASGSGITDNGDGTFGFGGSTYSDGSLTTFTLGGTVLQVTGGVIVQTTPGVDGETLADGSIVLADGTLLPAADVTLVQTGLPRGAYALSLSSDGDQRSLFTGKGGTIDLTPDKDRVVGVGDALIAVRRPSLVVNVVDQVGTNIPLATGDASLDVVVDQDGAVQRMTKTGPGSVAFFVDPTDLIAQLAAFSAVTPARDPSGTAEIPLNPDAVTPTDAGSIDVSVDLAGDGRFEYVDPADNPITIADTSTLAPVEIRLLRYTTVALKVAGDLKKTANDPLPGATVVVTVTFANETAPFSGTIGQYSSGYDAVNDVITWSPLVLTDGISASLTTLDLGRSDANLLFRNIRYPGCPTDCTATFAYTAHQSEFATDASATSTDVAQGTAVGPVDLLLTSPVLRQVFGTFSTTEDRKLVNAHVTVTATPDNTSKGTVVTATFDFCGFDRGDQEWQINILPRTKYTITATATPCDATTGGSYTNGTSIDINAKDGGTGKGNGSGSIGPLSIQFVAGGAVVTGRLDAIYPGADSTAAAAFTNCATSCPTIVLYAAADTTFASPIGTATYDATDGSFTIQDSAGHRVLPTYDATTDTYTDQMYVLRVTGPDLVAHDFPIGTLVENQLTTIDQTTYPLVSVLRAYVVDLAVKTGTTLQADITMSLSRTGTDYLTPFATGIVTPLTCTTGSAGDADEGVCTGLVLIPGSYSVTGPSGGSIIGVSGDDTTGDLALDLASPGPASATPTARTITVSLGFDIAVTVVSSGDGIRVQGAPVTLDPGGLTCTTLKSGDAGATPSTLGTCTISGASTGDYTATVADLSITGGSTYKVDPTKGNSLSISVNQPTMHFTGPDGAVVSITTNSTQTCTIASGTCPIALGSNVKADTVLTATASLGGQASTTSFQWRLSRSVALTALTDRTRTVKVTDTAGTPVVGAEVTFTPSTGTGGTAKQCFTNASGECPLAGLYADGYDISINQIGTVSPTSTTVSIAPSSATLHRGHGVGPDHHLHRHGRGHRHHPVGDHGHGHLHGRRRRDVVHDRARCRGSGSRGRHGHRNARHRDIHDHVLVGDEPQRRGQRPRRTPAAPAPATPTGSLDEWAAVHVPQHDPGGPERRPWGAGGRSPPAQRLSPGSRRRG